MKGYETWSFRDRSFLLGVAVSLGWHFFWFFAVTITVSPERSPAKPHPRIVSLGPVLDDSIFRTLVETRPQLSEAFYRRSSDFSAALEPPVRTIERHAPGDVVSVPFGKRFLDPMKVLAGDKAMPDHDFAAKIEIPYAEGALAIEGEAASRRVLTRPAEPLPVTARAVEVRFAVDAGGAVLSASIALSSGDPQADERFLGHVRGWQFEPLGLAAPGSEVTGVARFGPGGTAVAPPADDERILTP